MKTKRPRISNANINSDSQVSLGNQTFNNGSKMSLNRDNNNCITGFKKVIHDWRLNNSQEYVDALTKTTKNFIKLQRTYCSKEQLDMIMAYAKNIGYTIKYKEFKREFITNNGNGHLVKETLFYDLILENYLKDNNGNIVKAKHCFIEVIANNIYAIMRNVREDITYYVSSIYLNKHVDNKIKDNLIGSNLLKFYES